jgi:hypothetical protein
MLLISRQLNRNTVEFEGKVDLGENSIIIKNVSLVVDYIIGDYFLGVCD